MMNTWRYSSICELFFDGISSESTRFVMNQRRLRGLSFGVDEMVGLQRGIKLRMVSPAYFESLFLFIDNQ
ncbi:hypothetical protein [Hafnia paralvei]|uniref:Uncharacterized protein n=1 Tax=Hafnia paralvei TaxID=546367 RepID=A0A4Q9ESP4_9GAMM|nr:hypothetical protein [Hafnia paralvei]TBM28312.1 hypothetical protein EYY89_08965 [Hafnia paralvei]